ncbi:HNH endonuclease signature motif containing protein [Microbacterium elymi]|uniref:HNH endonuclease n=1 Tax=Microbacterium elymi TaxID=2909587 RepID=A0ABY5NII4_9MICO|nr:HNH endonuclease signature motif containing protein [Microbacterium elymi]UUT34919.1 HNH endonuclease [Microbacterium elymi]
MNAVDLLCRLTGVAATSARARIRHAHAVATRTTLTGDPLPAAFPTVRDALVDGVIGVDSIAAIVGALAPISDRCDPTHLAAAEYELVAAATGAGPDGAPACSADDSRTQAKVWTLVLDHDGTLPDYERALRHRGLRFGRERDGIVPISGGLLADVAAQFQRMGDAQLNPRVHDGTEDPGVRFRDAAEDDGDDAPPDTRTREQKMHDVFATILGVAARSAETPSLGGCPDPARHDLRRRTRPRRRGRLHRRHRRHGARGRRATDRVLRGIQRLVIDENGRLIELGSPNRTFSGQQRRAITARDGECIIPGCHVSATWCEIHHVIEHARGGPTHVDNGVPLCWWHHRSLETSGWEIRMVDGVPEVRAPATIDPRRLWQRVPGSLHRARDRLNRRLTG